MDTKQILEADLKDAMRSSDEMKKRVIRLILAGIKMAEIDKGSPLQETEVINLIQKEIKMRHEAFEGAEKAGRQDLMATSQEEIKLLEQFLPKQLSEEEIIEIARSAIQEVGASGPSGMGKVMKIALPLIQGRAPNDLVSKLIQELLNK